MSLVSSFLNVLLNVNFHNSFVLNRIKGKNFIRTVFHCSLPFIVDAKKPPVWAAFLKLHFTLIFLLCIIFNLAWTSLGFLNLRFCCLSPNLKTYQPLSLWMLLFLSVVFSRSSRWCILDLFCCLLLSTTQLLCYFPFFLLLFLILWTVFWISWELSFNSLAPFQFQICIFYF